MPNSWYTIKAKKHKKKMVGFVEIHSEIGYFGVSAEDFMRDFKEMGAVDHIELSIQSPGGSILDGLAIFNTLKNSPATVHASIKGLAASMASVIAMAADTVEMPETALFMIHRASGGVFGNADEMIARGKLLQKLEDMLSATYVNKTGLSQSEIDTMLAAETWLSGSEALAFGFIDSVTAPSESEDEDNDKARSRFDLSAFNNAPSLPPTSTKPAPRGQPKWSTSLAEHVIEQFDIHSAKQIATPPNMDEITKLLTALAAKLDALEVLQTKQGADMTALQDLMAEPTPVAPVAAAPAPVAPLVAAPAAAPAPVAAALVAAPVAAPVASAPVPTVVEADSTSEIAALLKGLTETVAALASAPAAAPAAAPAPASNVLVPGTDEPVASLPAAPAALPSYEDCFKADKEVNPYGYDYKGLSQYNEFGVQLATHMEMVYGTPAEYKASNGKRKAIL